MEAAHVPWRPLGRLLVEQGLLSEDELERALAKQVSTGGRLGETLVELGFVSRPALTRALADQYGIELTIEKGFGTGLRAEIERRHDQERADPAPALALVPEPEPPEPDELDGESLHLPQLEDQWAKLAAAEERLAEAERELTALRKTAERRRVQAERLIKRLRRRDEAAPPQLGARGPRGHLVYAQLAGGYVLVERDGEPPEPDVILELPEISEERLLVCRVGTSPLPHDSRPCVFAVQASESYAAYTR